MGRLALQGQEWKGSVGAGASPEKTEDTQAREATKRRVSGRSIREITSVVRRGGGEGGTEEGLKGEFKAGEMGVECWSRVGVPAVLNPGIS